MAIIQACATIKSISQNLHIILIREKATEFISLNKFYFKFYLQKIIQISSIPIQLLHSFPVSASLFCFKCGVNRILCL